MMPFRSASAMRQVSVMGPVTASPTRLVTCTCTVSAAGADRVRPSQISSRRVMAAGLDAPTKAVYEKSATRAVISMVSARPPPSWMYGGARPRGKTVRS
jgi:hypothetical protein